MPDAVQVHPQQQVEGVVRRVPGVVPVDDARDRDGRLRDPAAERGRDLAADRAVPDVGDERVDGPGAVVPAGARHGVEIAGVGIG